MLLATAVANIAGKSCEVISRKMKATNNKIARVGLFFLIVPPLIVGFYASEVQEILK